MADIASSPRPLSTVACSGLGELKRRAAGRRRPSYVPGKGTTPRWWGGGGEGLAGGTVGGGEEGGVD